MSVCACMRACCFCVRWVCVCVCARLFVCVLIVWCVCWGGGLVGVHVMTGNCRWVSGCLWTWRLCNSKPFWPGSPAGKVRWFAWVLWSHGIGMVWRRCGWLGLLGCGWHTVPGPGWEWLGWVKQCGRWVEGLFETVWFLDMLGP